MKTWILMPDAIFYNDVTAIKSITDFCHTWWDAERSCYRVLLHVLQLTLDRAEQSAWRSVSFSKVFPVLAIFAWSLEHTWTLSALSTPLSGKALAVLQEKITRQGKWAGSSSFSFDSRTLTFSVNWVPLLFLPSKMYQVSFTRLYSVGIMGKGATGAYATAIVTCLTLSTGIMSVICK